ncbi:MAG: SDR family NAD(P)-dependent oxidoreductase, partial [Pseudomonadota bacterium]
MGDDAQCRALVAAAMEAFGRIDFLVNNAGRTKFANHEDMDALSAQDFLDIYQLNTVARGMATSLGFHAKALD